MTSARRNAFRNVIVAYLPHGIFAGSAYIVSPAPVGKVGGPMNPSIPKSFHAKLQLAAIFKETILKGVDSLVLNPMKGELGTLLESEDKALELADWAKWAYPEATINVMWNKDKTISFVFELK